MGVVEMKRKHIVALFGLTAAVILIPLTNSTAFAYPVSPGDGPDAGTPSTSQLINPTGLFAVGEVDLSSLGASPTDLLGLGPTASTSDPGANLVVEPAGSDECPNAEFNSIQAAVTAATPGAKIKVCAGTYVEQVRIPAGKDDLTLYSVPDLQAIIKAPPVMTSPKAIVWINGAQNTTISHFTIEGPGGGPCHSIEQGVRVDAGGSALITDNHIADIHDTPFSGCQNGIGVLVGRNFENTFGSATVVHNLITNYQKGGVVVDGQLAAGAPASQAQVAYNNVEGIGPTTAIAQNGIQVSRGAVADVEHNSVSGNSFLPQTFVSVGILLFQDSSASTQVSHNDVFANDEGVGLYTTVDTTISHNNVHENTSGDGVFADTDTSGNVISYNKITNNTPFDCEDDSAGPNNPPADVANFWITDFGDTENRPGLCKHASP